MVELDEYDMGLIEFAGGIVSGLLAGVAAGIHSEVIAVIAIIAIVATIGFGVLTCPCALMDEGGLLLFIVGYAMGVFFGMAFTAPEQVWEAYYYAG